MFLWNNMNCKPVRCFICGAVISGVLAVEVGSPKCHKCEKMEIDPHPIHSTHSTANEKDLTYVVSGTTAPGMTLASYPSIDIENFIDTNT